MGLEEMNRLGDKIVPSVGARVETYCILLGMSLRNAASVESNGRCFFNDLYNLRELRTVHGGEDDFIFFVFKFSFFC